MFPFNMLDPFGPFGLNNYRPLFICGYKVDYNSPILEPCSGCGGRTYRSVKDRRVACCTGCKHLLDVFRIISYEFESNIIIKFMNKVDTYFRNIKHTLKLQFDEGPWFNQTIDKGGA